MPVAGRSKAPPNAVDLVARARAGSADALSALYVEYGRSLIALAYRLTGSHDDAEDVLHDVFLGLPEALHRYDERGALEPWLKRVTARVALSRMRKRTRAREVALADDVESRSAPTDASGDLVAVQQAIDALPDTLRVVFVLREVEGYSHSEIADLLDITTNASEVRLHRAIRMLRLTLGGSAGR